MVTTKSGTEGKTTVNYNNSFRLGSPINLPSMMDSYSFANLYNEATINGGGKQYFSDEQMQKMLDYVEKLDELDTSEVEPMSHIFQDENVFREDVVTNGDNKEAMLANAPKAKEGQYQVPKTIG